MWQEGGRWPCVAGPHLLAIRLVSGQQAGGVGEALFQGQQDVPVSFIGLGGTQMGKNVLGWAYEKLEA
jgi:hypothetical protein